MAVEPAPEPLPGTNDNLSFLARLQQFHRTTRRPTACRIEVNQRRAQLRMLVAQGCAEIRSGLHGRSDSLKSALRSESTPSRGHDP